MFRQRFVIVFGSISHEIIFVTVAICMYDLKEEAKLYKMQFRV
jgi:hypothetical protein